MTTDNEKRFYDLKMPRWYCIAAWACRVLGLVTTIGGLLVAVYVSEMESVGGFCCFFIGLILFVLPSLPKAFIEQWNRIKGLQDGSFLAGRIEKKDEKS